jgi:hypothetical protein
MNGFEKHGIDHTSASQINMWNACPHAWIGRYLYGLKGNFSVAAKCGVLVEDACVHILLNIMTQEQAIENAYNELSKFIMLSDNESDLKRLEALEGMITLAMEELNKYGTPEFDIDVMGNIKQKDINIKCNCGHFKLKVEGYMDFVFPEVKTVIDLKTTLRLPSVMPDNHRVQGSLYKQATKYDVKFLYVTGKKSNVIEIEDTGDVLADIKKTLIRQEKFLSLGEKEELKDIVPIIRDSYYHEDVYDELYI